MQGRKLSMQGRKESFPGIALLFRKKHVISVRAQVKRFDAPREGPLMSNELNRRSFVAKDTAVAGGRGDHVPARRLRERLRRTDRFDPASRPAF